MKKSPTEKTVQPDAPKKRPGKLRRAWKWLWRSSVVLLLLAYLTRNAVLGPWVLGKIEVLLADTLGGEVELDGIGGGWWSEISLDTARSLEDAKATPLRSFELQGIQAEYSLWELIRGKPDWLKSVQIAQLKAEIDAQQGRPSEEPEQADDPIELPAGLPRISVAQVQLRYVDGETSAAVRGASLQSPEAGRLLLDIPAFDFARGDQLAPTTALRTEWRYAEGVLEIPSLLVDEIERVQAARLDLSGLASGELGFDLALSVLDGSFSAQGSLADGRVQAALSAEGLVAEELEPYLDLGLRGQLEFTGSVNWPIAEPLEGVAEFEFGAAQNGWRRVELEAVTGSLRVAQGWLVSEQFRAQGPDLDLVARNCRVPLFAADPEAAPTGGSVQLSVRDLPGWLARLELELPSETETLQTLELEARVQSRAERIEVQLDRLQLDSGLGSWIAQGSTALIDRQLALESPVALQLEGSEVPLEKLTAFLQQHGRIEQGLNLPTAGRAALTLHASGTAAQPEIELTLQVRNLDPGPLHEQLPRGPYQSQLSLRADGQTLRLAPFVLSGPELECTVQAEAQLPLNLVSLSTGELPTLAGAFASTLVMRASPQGAYSGTAELRSQLNGELGTDFLPVESTVHWELLAEKWRAADFAAELERLEASGSASWQGVAPIPTRWQATVAAFGLRKHEGELATLRGEASWSEQQLRARLDSSEDPVFPLLLDAELPLDFAQLNELPDGPIRAELRFSDDLNLEALQQQLRAFALPLPESMAEFQARGAVRLAAHASGSWQDPQLQLELDGTAIEWIPTDPEAKPTLPGPLAIQASLAQNGNTVVLETLHASSGPARLEAQGSWTVESAFIPLLASGEEVPEGKLAFDAALELPDASFLESVPGIRRIEGAASAEIAVRGTDRAPHVTADWSYRNGSLRLDDPTVAAFDRLTFSGRYADQQLELVACEGELGSAPFAATGTVDLSEETPQLDVRLTGTDLLLYRRKGVKIRSDTALRIHGALDALRTEGELTLTDGRYTKPVDFILPLLRKGQPPTGGVEGISLFSLMPPLDTMQLDLRVHPGNGFRIKTNVANGMIRPDLRLVGTGEVPYLLGEIYFDRTILSMPAHRITLEQGVIRFTEENPFVPTLDMRAGFRRYGYDVTILIEGDVTAPVITMSSVPPLSAEELLLFTTTGQPPQENANAQEALGTVAVYLAQDWLRRFFGDLSTEEEESLFDRIEIEFGRDSTNQGAETIEGRFLLRRDNLVENDALFLTGERDAYSDFNLGLRIRFLFP